MQVTTWIDRITDESTLWLNAVRSEEQNEFVRAAGLYLRDASVSLGQKMPVWAALSCACAADCLREAGLPTYANILYRESGRIYLEKADAVARASVREMLWCLRQSYQYFLLAGDGETANEVYRRMLAISRRIDPFSVDAPVTLPEAPEPRKNEDRAIGEILQGSEIIAEVEKFLESRESGKYATDVSAPPRASVTPQINKGFANEKSIINQLG